MKIWNHKIILKLSRIIIVAYSTLMSWEEIESLLKKEYHLLISTRWTSLMRIRTITHIGIKIWVLMKTLISQIEEVVLRNKVINFLLM